MSRDLASADQRYELNRGPLLEVMSDKQLKQATCAEWNAWLTSADVVKDKRAIFSHLVVRFTDL